MTFTVPLQRLVSATRASAGHRDLAEICRVRGGGFGARWSRLFPPPILGYVEVRRSPRALRGAEGIGSVGVVEAGGVGLMARINSA